MALRWVEIIDIDGDVARYYFHCILDRPHIILPVVERIQYTLVVSSHHCIVNDAHAYAVYDVYISGS